MLTSGITQDKRNKYINDYNISRIMVKRKTKRIHSRQSETEN